MTPPPDLWSRVDYRRLVAWPERLERERPLLLDVLGRAPSRLVLDLGCGTGEHSRFLASLGYEVVGIDSSGAMIAHAVEDPVPPALTFVQAAIEDLESVVSAPAGAAICLGNTLPHLEPPALERFVQALRRRLLPGAPFLFQVLNYERIFARRLQHLPLNVRSGRDGDTVVFLRLMDPRPDGTVIFSPTTLRYRPDQDPPVEVVSSRSVRLRGWTRPELHRLLTAAGFAEFEACGDMSRTPYDPLESPDLVAIAR
jgi:SAM-dependent methyltransferase